MAKWPLTDYEKIIAAVRAFDDSKYAGTRNFTNGHVSRFSPYISRGCISTKLVFDAVVKRNPKAVRGKFVQELLWRDYFQRLLQARPDLHETGIREPKPSRRKNGLPKAILDAKTGIDAIDEAINGLYETGYMHNHFRMYTAAVCCNIAKFKFQDPGRWLYYHLLDGDIGSNFASWQWVSGHLTNRRYIANQANINRYSREEQHGTFLDKTYLKLEKMRVPEILSEAIKPELTTKLPPTELPKLTDKPVLLYTFYNLDPKWHARGQYNRVLILDPEHFKAFPVSEKVIDFTLKLAQNIKGLQIFSGSFAALQAANPNLEYIAKEHPILSFDGVTIEERDWIVPEVSGYFQSFGKYYTACRKYLIKE